MDGHMDDVRDGWREGERIRFGEFGERERKQERKEMEREEGGGREGWIERHREPDRETFGAG